MKVEKAAFYYLYVEGKSICFIVPKALEGEFKRAANPFWDIWGEPYNIVTVQTKEDFPKIQAWSWSANYRDYANRAADWPKGNGYCKTPEQCIAAAEDALKMRLSAEVKKALYESGRWYHEEARTSTRINIAPCYGETFESATQKRGEDDGPEIY